MTPARISARIPSSRADGLSDGLGGVIDELAGTQSIAHEQDKARHDLKDCRRVSIDGLTLQTSLGVYAFEKLARRQVTIDAVLWIPLALCTPQDDQLAEVVDYEDFHKVIVGIVNDGHVHLIESLVDRIADALIAHVAVKAVHVRVAKMAVFDDCRSISIDARRGF